MSSGIPVTGAGQLNYFNYPWLKGQYSYEVYKPWDNMNLNYPLLAQSMTVGQLMNGPVNNSRLLNEFGILNMPQTSGGFGGGGGMSGGLSNPFDIFGGGGFGAGFGAGAGGAAGLGAGGGFANSGIPTGLLGGAFSPFNNYSLGGLFPNAPTQYPNANSLLTLDPVNRASLANEWGAMNIGFQLTTGIAPKYSQFFM
ncbi:MAG: hypothetical protein IPK79_10170 [Vampirovibrionales bacterium]|nr:hypothetical protein [Vampirovibrionales bacterium]